MRSAVPVAVTLHGNSRQYEPDRRVPSSRYVHCWRPSLLQSTATTDMFAAGVLPEICAHLPADPTLASCPTESSARWEAAFRTSDVRLPTASYAYPIELDAPAHDAA